MREFFFYLLLVANSVNMLHLGLYIVSANIYDILKFRKPAPDASTLPRKRRPLVSVIMAAHNEEAGIARTLDSVRASTYKRIEVIIVDDGSTDRTAQIVRRYIQRSPLLRTQTYMSRYKRGSKLMRRFVRADLARQRIVLVTQANAGKGSALNNALRNHVRGQLVMTLDADSILEPTAIEHAVKYFNDPRVIGVGANVRIMASGSWLGMLQRFEHMIAYRSKKFYTLVNCEFIIGGVASTYRTKVLRRAGFYDTDTLTEDIGLSIKLVDMKGNRDYRIVYGADVAAMTEGVQTYKALLRQRYRWKMGSLQNLLKHRRLVANTDHRKYGYLLTFYRLPMAVFSELLLLMEPVIMCYVVYLSIAYGTPWIFVGAYLIITFYILWTVWPDEYLARREKFVMSLQAIPMYVIFFAMDVVQISAVIRCLVNYKKIIHRPEAQTWISPARAGQAAKA